MAGNLFVIAVPLTALVLAGGCFRAEPVKTEADVAWSESAQVLHNKCAATFERFVDARGMVDYKQLRQERHELGLLLGELGKIDRNMYSSWSKEDKIAFWINTYNLQKLKAVVDNYPIVPSSPILAGYWGPHSVRHIEGNIAGHRFTVMGEQLTFAEIEKRFFREQFGDPRVFFALTSASLSSPPLRSGPYYGITLDEQLGDQVKRFLSGPMAFKVDREKNIVYLSALFEVSSHGRDFADKFGTDEKFRGYPPTTRAALNFITDYISPNDVSFLEVGDYSVKYMKHDWTINDGS